MSEQVWHLVRALCVYGLMQGSVIGLLEEAQWAYHHPRQAKQKFHHYYDRMPKGRKSRYRR